MSQNRKFRGRFSRQCLFISLLCQQLCSLDPNTNISPRGLKMAAKSAWSNRLPCSHPGKWEEEKRSGTDCSFPETLSKPPRESPPHRLAHICLVLTNPWQARWNPYAWVRLLHHLGCHGYWRAQHSVSTIETYQDGLVTSPPLGTLCFELFHNKS